MPAHLKAELHGSSEGMAVVFLHSLGGSATQWKSVTDALRGVRSIAVDLPGHGRASVPPAPCSTDDTVGDLLAVLDELDIARCVLVGCSLGGLVAQAFALAFADRVDGLLLTNTAPRLGSVESWNDRIALVTANGLDATASAIASRWFAPGFADRAPEVVGDAVAVLRSTPEAGYVGMCALLRDTDLWPLIDNIVAPVLVLTGEHDIVVPPDLARRFAGAVPNARYVEIPGSGHLTHLDAPAPVSAHILDFLTELGYVRTA